MIPCYVWRIDGGVTEPTILAAAALHDTIEDTETTEEELGTGDEIAPLIFDRSVVDGLPQASVRPAWAARCSQCGKAASVTSSV